MRASRGVTRIIFVFLLVAYAIWPDVVTQTPLFLIGGSKVYTGDMFFVLSVVGIGFASLSGRRLRLRHSLLLSFFALILAYGAFESMRGLGLYGYSAFGDHARAEYYIALIGLFAYFVYPEVRNMANLLRELYAIGALAAAVTVGAFLYFLAEPASADIGWIRFSNSLTSLFMVFSLVYLVNKTLMRTSLGVTDGFVGMLLAIGLLLGQARTDWVAGAVAMAVLVWVHRDRTKRVLVLGAVVVVAAVAMYWLVEYFIPTPVTYSLAKSSVFLNGLGEDTDWVWRLTVWQEVLRQSLTTPILGKGMGAPFQFSAFGVSYLNLPPHNGWLMLFYSEGLVGILLNLAVFFVALMYLLKITRLFRRDKYIVFIASTLFAMIVVQFAYFVPYGSTLFTWVLPGLAAVLWRKRFQLASERGVPRSATGLSLRQSPLVHSTE